MLTKQEREEIANTARSLEGCTLYYKEIYRCLFGKYPQDEITSEEEDKEILILIIDLCDTSNMLELPVDKDGEVIRIGDVVYDNNGKKYNVDGYVIHSTCKNIIRVFNSNSGLTNRFASGLTHKKPVTIKSLAQRIRDVLRNDHSEMSPYASHELVHIANDLERLGDSDD